MNQNKPEILSAIKAQAKAFNTENSFNEANFTLHK
jgi:hypothetical protein